MKNRTSLVLMEQLIMILTFSLAAAVCLGLFARADAISRETARRDEAVVLAQNAAEWLKSGGDPGELARQTEHYTVTIHPVEPQIPGLNQARIEVAYDNEVLFSLTTGWQEEAS